MYLCRLVKVLVVEVLEVVVLVKDMLEVPVLVLLTGVLEVGHAVVLVFVLVRLEVLVLELFFCWNCLLLMYLTCLCCLLKR